MPDLWMDVDVALAEVPVNIMPLIDATDFKTRKEAVAYNDAGLELIWHFTTTAGATSATVVTPTTGGAYDWAHQDGGMYTIEIPASGGASINNDAEGFGWFTGIATGVLPWRGPIIGFRAAGLNNLLIDDAYSTTRGLAGTALPDAAADAAGGLPISDAGGLDIDAKLANTNEVTAARMGALTDLIDGGRLDLLIDAIKAKTDNLPADPADDSDIDAQLATIAGYLDTEVAAILAAVDTEVAAIKAKTDQLNFSGTDVKATLDGETVTVGTNNDKTGYALTSAYDAAKTAAAAGAQMDLIDAPNATALAAIRNAVQAAGSTLATLLSRVIGTLAAGTHNPQTGDAYARLGAPSGASVSADIAAIPAPPDVSGIEAVTEKLDTMLEADDDDYRFTEAALVNAPAGEGGGPSAVQIRQEIDANSTQLIAIKAKTDNIPAGTMPLKSETDAIATAVGQVKTQTDKLSFAGSDVKATLDGEKVTVANNEDKAGYSLDSAPPTAAEVADKLLGRSLAGGADGGRTVTQALRALRNKIAIAAGTMTVYEEDDTTPDWTGAVTTDPAAEPITEIDPA